MQYNILWVDDRKDEFVELDYPNKLIKYVSEQFFEVSLDFYETVEDGKKAIETRKYDVIFSDYNIGDNDKGDDFISFVRNSNVNTEILFYSALNMVPKLNMDRISFYNIPTPGGNLRLLERMKHLIDLTIEKLSDLQVIRGIVMSEVSELDILMETIIHKYFVASATEEKTELFHKHITSDVEGSVKKKLSTKNLCTKQCIHKWREQKIEDIIGTLEFESSKKAQSIHCILLDIKGIYPIEQSFSKDYGKDIITMRNNLAHCISYKDGDKEVLKVKKKGAVDIVFDSELFKKIRQNIRKYKIVLESILASLNNN